MDDGLCASSPARAVSLTATIIERLRNDIINGTIPLGSLLSEKTLAEEYGVSKTPVREALVQLQSLGLVAILPQRGGLVFHPDAEQVRELCEVRLELESAALRFAMRRDRAGLLEALSAVVQQMVACFDLDICAAYQVLDNEFHTTIFRFAGNRLLSQTYATLSPRISALRTRLTAPQSYMLKRSIEEHRLFLELVESNAVRDALQLLSEHIGRTQVYHSRAAEELVVERPIRRRRPRRQ